MGVKDLTAPVTMASEFDCIPDDLAAKRLGRKIHYFAEIDSTNTHARRLAEQGAPEGEVVVAETQTEGRGRLGRRWVSPPRANLYFSIILRPQMPPVDVPQITLMAAVALVETIRSVVQAPATIKWPNDILVKGKKLAGILTELSLSGERVEFVLLGIGLNVNFPPVMMPPDLRARATSILDWTKKEVSRAHVLRRLIQDLDRCYGELEDHGFGVLAPRWEAYFGLRGVRVRVELLDQVLVGKAKGIDRDGALILEDDQGYVKRIVAGDLIPVED